MASSKRGKKKPLTEEELLHYLENDDLSEASFLSDDNDNDLGWDSTEEIDNDFNQSIQEELDIDAAYYNDGGEDDEINERQENEHELIENEENENTRNRPTRQNFHT